MFCGIWNENRGCNEKIECWSAHESATYMHTSQFDLGAVKRAKSYSESIALAMIRIEAFQLNIYLYVCECVYVQSV